MLKPLHRKRLHLSVLLLIVGIMIGVTGCGQKGDLYLPTEEPKQSEDQSDGEPQNLSKDQPEEPDPEKPE